MASENGHRNVVQSLLGAGADVNLAASDVSDVVFNYYRTRGHRNLLSIELRRWRGEANI